MTTTKIQPEALAALELATPGEQVRALKDWCLENYEAGADTMVECWDGCDYEELLARNGGFAAAYSLLQRLADIYSDQQADAAFHRSQAR